MRRNWMVLAALTAAACAGESAKDIPGDQPRAATPAPAPASAPPALSPSTSQSVQARSNQQSADGEIVVLIVGTSLTAGLGLDPEEAYPALLQEKASAAGLPVRIVNAGLSGETSAGALRRVDWLLRNPADVIVIETGANDGLRGLDIDSTRANLSDILARVRAAKPDAELLLMEMEAPPNLGVDYTTRFREMFPSVAREHGATLVPFLLDGVAGIPRFNQADGIHPNRQGARRVADNVWRTLAAVLERLARPK